MAERPVGSTRRSFGEEFVRVLVLVMLALLSLWLAWRVVTGILRLFVWLATTAIVIALIVAALSVLLRGKRR